MVRKYPPLESNLKTDSCLAIGFGIVYILSPVWIGENVRPELRGFFLCLMNGAIVFGQLVLAGTARGVSTIQGEWSYKTLILLQFIFVGK